MNWTPPPKKSCACVKGPMTDWWECLRLLRPRILQVQAKLLWAISLASPLKIIYCLALCMIWYPCDWQVKSFWECISRFPSFTGPVLSTSSDRIWGLERHFFPRCNPPTWCWARTLILWLSSFGHYKYFMKLLLHWDMVPGVTEICVPAPCHSQIKLPLTA